MKSPYTTTLATALVCLAFACKPETQVLKVGVTTSTRDAGLLDELVPEFEKQHSVRVDLIAAGTGKVLKLGEAGDVDVLVVHAREAEDAFIAAGHGTRREDLMYNVFEILGPPEDPAKIRGLAPGAALAAIGKTEARFVSRGDDSGTHKRELSLWNDRPEWNGYVESGSGMGRSLIMADQMQAYVLTDRGTYLKFRSKISLIPLADSTHPSMRNEYGVIVVQGKLADAFADYLTSESVQRAIGDYTVEGQTLFHPLKLPKSDGTPG